MCSVDQLINKQTNVCPLDDQKHAEHKHTEAYCTYEQYIKCYLHLVDSIIYEIIDNVKAFLWTVSVDLL